MSRDIVYNQINEFNKMIINDKETKTKKYYYVQSEIAEDKAKFVKYLVNNDNLFKDKYSNAIDLCYGSGNLTTHIHYDGGIKWDALTLNDINEEDRNNDIEIGTKTSLDVLDHTSFSDRYDLIIFNPQIGGSTLGSINFESTLTPILYSGKLEEYLISEGIDTSDFDITEDYENNICLIHSEVLGKKEMLESGIPSIKIFNYCDVFYSYKQSTRIGTESNIVRFRKTISKISNEDAIVIFLGEEKHYNLLFADYTYVRQYITDGKQFFILGRHNVSKECFHLNNNDFEKTNCSQTTTDINDIEDFDTLDLVLNGCDKMEKENISDDNNETFSDDGKGKLDFDYKNILFKGVPGTGKSRAVNKIIKNQLDLAKNDKNVLRINIHSASSNSDLMQGIGISTNNKGGINYSEKEGLILGIIKRATFHPAQPFALILEEIQENSLNELIGDLIYLIEEDKRAKLIANNQKYASYEDLVDELVKNDDTLNYVEVPFLVDDSTNYKKMIMPNNLFIFCTSNYRDDKKVIEDNLLRRFEVIEMYPKETVVNKYARDFFEKLNKSINVVMEKQGEVHPDRFLIGHAIWKDVKNKEMFYKSFSKLITEFKDIREIEFDIFKTILKNLPFPDDIEIKILNSYYEMTKNIQQKIGYEFIN